jgi:protocatechuate 3,4-dioxygenase beta subunit
MEEENKRRTFLKNASFTALSIGIASSVKGINTFNGFKPAGASCNETTLDYYGQGPFYTANPPLVVSNQLATITEVGTRLIITGRVYNLDCTEFIPNAEIDIWHANDAGQYDNSGYNLRGIVKSDSQGYYQFETIKPGKYLNGASYRPSHIHIKVTPPGFTSLITQLYFTGDTDIPGDAAASISTGTYDASNRIIPISLNGNGKYEGTWDVVVNGSGVTVGVSDLRMDKGILYEISPNPFKNQIKIKYGVFTDSKVSIEIFNLKGELIDTLVDEKMGKEKYSITWKPEDSLPKGCYVVGLKINDIQVQHIKIIKE